MSEDALSAQVAALYDEKAPEYDAHYRRRTDHAEDAVLYGWLQDLAHRKSVLDVGCGTGAALDHLDPVRYIGVDVSSEMLKRAAQRLHPDFQISPDDQSSWLGWHHRERNMSATFVKYDISAPRPSGTISVDGTFESGELPLTSRLWHVGLGDFDLAMSLWAFPHFSDQQRALEQMAECVKPGGWVVVQGFAERYARRPNYILNGHGAELLRPTLSGDLDWMMGQAGLATVKVVGFRYLLDPPGLNLLPTGTLAAAFRASSRLLPADWAATHVVFAQKPEVAIEPVQTSDVRARRIAELT